MSAISSNRMEEADLGFCKANGFRPCTAHDKLQMVLIMSNSVEEADLRFAKENPWSSHANKEN